MYLRHTKGLHTLDLRFAKFGHLSLKQSEPVPIFHATK